MRSLRGVIFIDLSKAFDAVSRSNVLNKLSSFGISGNELMWLYILVILTIPSIGLRLLSAMYSHHKLYR